MYYTIQYKLATILQYTCTLYALSILVFPKPSSLQAPLTQSRLSIRLAHRERKSTHNCVNHYTTVWIITHCLHLCESLHIAYHYKESFSLTCENKRSCSMQNGQQLVLASSAVGDFLDLPCSNVIYIFLHSLWMSSLCGINVLRSLYPAELTREVWTNQVCLRVAPGNGRGPPDRCNRSDRQ